MWETVFRRVRPLTLQENGRSQPRRRTDVAVKNVTTHQNRPDSILPRLIPAAAATAAGVDRARGRCAFPAAVPAWAHEPVHLTTKMPRQFQGLGHM